jgi:acyl carrier protein
MQNAEIQAALTDVFRETFDDDSIVLEPNIAPADIPGWDSARYITLIVATEARFAIRFQPAELESLRTIGDFVGRISGKITEAGC